MALVVECTVQMSHFIADGLSIIPLMTLSEAWGAMGPVVHFGPSWKLCMVPAQHCSMQPHSPSMMGNFRTVLRILSVCAFIFVYLWLLRHKFFTVFATYLVVVPVRVLFLVQNILLVVGPVLVATLEFLLFRYHARPIRGFGRVWLAAAIAIGLQTALVIGYVKLNPYVSLVQIS